MALDGWGKKGMKSSSRLAWPSDLTFLFCCSGNSCVLGARQLLYSPDLWGQDCEVKEFSLFEVGNVKYIAKEAKKVVACDTRVCLQLQADVECSLFTTLSINITVQWWPQALVDKSAGRNLFQLPNSLWSDCAFMRDQVLVRLPDWIKKSRRA